MPRFFRGMAADVGVVVSGVLLFIAGGTGAMISLDNLIEAFQIPRDWLSILFWSTAFFSAAAVAGVTGAMVHKWRKHHWERGNRQY